MTSTDDAGSADTDHPDSGRADTSSAETGDTSRSETGDTSSAETGDTSSAETGDTSSAETGDTSSAETGDDEVVLDEVPGLVGLYARAVRGGGAPPDAPLTTATVTVHDIAVDRAHVAAFADVCALRVRDVLPATYPYVRTFPLAVHLLARDDAPFPLLGLVHLHQRVVVHRPLTAEDRLDATVRLADLRPHRSGRTVDVHTTVTSADEVVWTGTATYLHRGGGRGDDRPAGTTPTQRPTDAVEATALPTTARWEVPADIGRRFASVSGDRNPIHLSAATARPLGFDSAIAHGMWTATRALGSLEGRAPDASAIDVAFGSPLRLPSRVELATAARGDDWRLAVRARDGERVHLTGVVTPTPS